MSSFIERFSIAGSAGVLTLMVVLGVYGLASLMAVEPDGSPNRPPGSEEFLVLEGRGIPIGTQVRPQASPAVAQPREPTPAEPERLETPADEALLELEPAAFADALSGGNLDGPAAPAPATPAPAPGPTAVANTPAPAPDAAPPATPEPPAPTPTAEPTPLPLPTLPPLPIPDPTLPVP
jgi:hypothetical protein